MEYGARAKPHRNGAINKSAPCMVFATDPTTISKRRADRQRRHRRPVLRQAPGATRAYSIW